MSGRVGIGMRRLSIIDLAGGHQPIFNEDETIAVVLNGEIYNYRELRRDLAARGHTFRTSSDTETIVHLYEEYGADCVSRLRGMFGFALWDERKRVLVLARDRFGMKPLYVAQAEGQLAFASELKALFAAGAVCGELDFAALESFFRLGYVPAPRTPFRGVSKLEPGHVLVWRDGEVTTRRYWELPAQLRGREVEPDEVLSWIDESVGAHLVSDVPLAVLLSGGLDSSAVFSSMAVAGITPHAFTARYGGTGAASADETGLARALVDRYGAKLTVVDVAPDVADVLESIVYALDEPHADEAAVPTWLLTRAVAAEYKVVLAGTGGDELFAGYRRHLGLLASEWYTGLPSPVRGLIRSGAALLPEPRTSLGVHRLKRFVQASPGSVPARYYDLLNKLADLPDRSLFAPEIASQIPAHPAAAHIARVHAEGGSRSGLEAALQIDYMTYLPDDILHLSDRIAMAHSLEVRVPFVDHVLVEKAFPLPDRVKIGYGKPKKLLRRALASRLPDAHFRAPKRGFVGPTASWLRNELRDMVQDELSPDRIGRLGIFDARVVSGLIDDHMTRRHNREAALWSLLSFSVWHRVFMDNAATPTASSLDVLPGALVR